MIYIELASWIALALLLATLHTFIPKQRPESPTLLYAAMILGALIGGLAVELTRIPLLVVGGYSIAKLLGALVISEVTTLFLQRPPSHPRTT